MPCPPIPATWISLISGHRGGRNQTAPDGPIRPLDPTTTLLDQVTMRKTCGNQREILARREGFEPPTLRFEDRPNAEERRDLASGARQGAAKGGKQRQ